MPRTNLRNTANKKGKAEKAAKTSLPKTKNNRRSLRKSQSLKKEDIPNTTLEFTHKEDLQPFIPAPPSDIDQATTPPVSKCKPKEIVSKTLGDIHSGEENSQEKVVSKQNFDNLFVDNCASTTLTSLRYPFKDTIPGFIQILKNIKPTKEFEETHRAIRQNIKKKYTFKYDDELKQDVLYSNTKTKHTLSRPVAPFEDVFDILYDTCVMNDHKSKAVELSIFNNYANISTRTVQFFTDHICEGCRQTPNHGNSKNKTINNFQKKPTKNVNTVDYLTKMTPLTALSKCTPLHPGIEHAQRDDMFKVMNVTLGKFRLLLFYHSFTFYL